MQAGTDIDVAHGPIARLSSGHRPLIYIAEDDDDLRETLAELFAYDGYAVRAAPDGGTIFDWLFREHRPSSRLPDVIVTDHRMPGYCALDILECLADVQWTIPVIVITAYGHELRNMARSLGACAFFEKPFDPDVLRSAAQQCVDGDITRIKTARGHNRGRFRTGDA